MPYKDFQVNEILTAADVNDYLMDQSVMTFADAAARDAALTAPTEGMFAFLSGTDLLTFYDGSAWQEFTSGGGGVTVSETAPTDPADGDLWWDSGDGQMYLWYDADSVWVSAAGPSVAVQSTAPTGYEGQLWLDDTDGSMYVYYTDPGGGSSQWIGAVSRSGGILQVVSTTKTDTFSASIGAGASTSVTGLTVDITPRSTSSKILVTATIVGGRNGGQIGAALTADGTHLNLGDVAGSRTSVQSASSGGTDNLPSAITVQALHSPSTTSTVTYGVDLFGIITSGSTYYLNRSTNDTNSTAGQRSSSTITAIEVAG